MPHYTISDGTATVASFDSDALSFSVYDDAAQSRVANWVVGSAPPVDPPPVDPPPVDPPPPVVSGGLFNPATGAELQAAWQAALDGGYTLLCDGRALPVLSGKITLQVHDQGSNRHGIRGNGMRLQAQQSGDYMVDVGLNENQNRHMECTGLGFDGGNYRGVTVGGLRFIQQPDGGGWYFARIGDLNFEACQDGITIAGNVFESLMRDVFAINCDRGAVGTMQPGQSTKILSNFVAYGMFLKQCRVGIELDHANSFDLMGGSSFVDCTERAIIASNGMRRCYGGNIENGGDGHAIDIASTDWPMLLSGWTLSNTRGGNPYLCRYTGDPAKMMSRMNQIHVGTAIFTPDSTLQSAE